MSDISEKEIDRLALLCRIEYTSEEKERLKGSLARVLDYFEELKNLDLEGVQPCDHILDHFQLFLREDEVGELLPRDTFLAGAPAHNGWLVRIPAINSDQVF